MRMIFLILVMGAALLFGSDSVSYKVYGNVKVVQDGKKIGVDTTLKNGTTVTLKGKGKVVFFYPCGVPKIIKVKEEKSVHVLHHCKDNSIAKSLLTNFFDNWFKEDEKIVIAASSRSTENIKRGANYFVVDQKSIKDIAIPLYDEDADYSVVMNNKKFSSAMYTISDTKLSIPATYLSKHNQVEVYEDGVKVYDFTIDVIDKGSLAKKYPSQQLSLLEKALLYAKDTNQQLYIQNINYLLQ